MARDTFFSFRFEGDSWRAGQDWNSNLRDEGANIHAAHDNARVKDPHVTTVKYGSAILTRLSSLARNSTLDVLSEIETSNKPGVVPVTPPPEHGRLDWLDGVRTFAIFGVIFVHAGLVAMAGGREPTGATHLLFRLSELGQYGVQPFFIVSALTVFLTLGRFPYSGPEYRGWLVKRIFRIAPLYYFGIALYFIGRQLMNVVRAHTGMVRLPLSTWRDVLMNVAFLHTWDVHSNNSVVPGGWSISVEVFFYVLAPLCFFVYRRAYLIVPVFLVVSALCLTITHLAAGGSVVNASFLYFWFPTQFPVLLLGLVFCRISSHWLLLGEDVPSIAVPLALLVAGPALLGAIWFGPPYFHDSLYAPLLMGVVACSVIVLARTVLRRFFSHRRMVWAGRISYSVYIVHFVILDVLRNLSLKFHIAEHLSPAGMMATVTPLTLASALLVATGTRLWIEEPGIHMGRRLARAITR